MCLIVKSCSSCYIREVDPGLCITIPTQRNPTPRPSMHRSSRHLKPVVPLRLHHYPSKKSRPQPKTPPLSPSPTTPAQKSEGALRGERIQAYCKILWGDCYCDIEFEAEDDDHYAFIRKDLGDSYGPLLLDSERCGSMDEASAKLERMLAAACKHFASKKASDARQGKRA